MLEILLTLLVNLWMSEFLWKILLDPSPTIIDKAKIETKSFILAADF